MEHLGITFNQIKLDDKEWMIPLLKQADFRGCEYSFANLFMWRDVSGIRIANVDGFLCIYSNTKGGSLYYQYPAGSVETASVIEKMKEDARIRNIPFCIRGILEEQKNKLEEDFPNQFVFHLDDGERDYLYPVDVLTNLAGKKYHGKRNHIRRFMDAEDWSYEAVTKENLHECIHMNDEWCHQYGCEKSEGAKTEQCAVKQAFQYFDELSLEGGLLKKGWKAVAFSIGEPLNSDTYVVHIEKAFPNIQGAYPMINKQFVLNRMQEFMYVNREEDTGDEGLRKAKMSYGPNPWLKKYSAMFQEGEVTNG